MTFVYPGIQTSEHSMDRQTNRHNHNIISLLSLQTKSLIVNTVHGQHVSRRSAIILHARSTTSTDLSTTTTHTAGKYVTGTI